MAERLWCFTGSDRLLTMSETGAARIWEVLPTGWLMLSLGPPEAEERGPAWSEEAVSDLLRKAVGGDQASRDRVRELAGLTEGKSPDEAWQVEHDDTVAMTPVPPPVTGGSDA